MRWTREQRDLLSKFAEKLKATEPRSNGRVEWRSSMYAAWEDRWTLDSGVKKVSRRVPKATRRSGASTVTFRPWRTFSEML